MVRLTEFLDQRVTVLSGGQRQRVAIARALVTKPEILLLDEPLSALDANLRVHMQAEMKRLQQTLGIAFIYITHNQSEAFSTADRVVVMNRGQIEQIGTPREIYLWPQTRFAAEFVGSNNLLEGRIASVDGELIASRLRIRPLLRQRCPTDQSGRASAAAEIIGHARRPGQQDAPAAGRRAA